MCLARYLSNRKISIIQETDQTLPGVIHTNLTTHVQIRVIQSEANAEQNYQSDQGIGELLRGYWKIFTALI